MINTVDAELLDLIDDGDVEYPIVVCTNTNGDCKYFGESDIWSDSLEVDRYRSVGNSPEIGTAIAAECKVSFRYDEDFMQYFADGWDLCVFVGCKSYWDCSHLTDGSTFGVAKTVAQIQDIYDALESGERKQILYVGDTDDIGDSDRVGFGQVVILQKSEAALNYLIFAPVIPLGIFYVDGIKASDTSISVTALDCMALLDKPVYLIGLGGLRCAPHIPGGRGYFPPAGTNIYATDPWTGYKFVDDTYAGIGVAMTDYITTFTEIADRIERVTGVGVQRLWRLPDADHTQRQPYIYGDDIARFTDNYTYRQLLQFIGQLTGTWFYASQTERGLIKCNAVPVGDEYITLDKSMLYTYEMGSLAPIKIRNIVIPSNGKTYFASVSQNGSVDYNISNNPFLTNVPREHLITRYAQEIASAMKAYNMDEYQPFKATIVQRPYLELSDAAVVTYPNGDTTVSPITRITYRLNQPMAIECAGSSDTISTIGSGSSGSSATVVKNTLNNVRTTDMVSASTTVFYNGLGVAPQGIFRVSSGLNDYSLFFVTLATNASTPTYHRLLCYKDLTSATALSAIAGSLVTLENGTRKIYTTRISFTADDTAGDDTDSAKYKCYVNTAESSASASDCKVIKLEGIL